MALINPNRGTFYQPQGTAPTLAPPPPTGQFGTQSIFQPPAAPTTPTIPSPTAPAAPTVRPPGTGAIPRPTTPTTPGAGPQSADIQRWYQQYLNRPGSAVEWNPWVGNQQAETSIAGSEEARRYRAAQAAAAAAGQVTSTATPNTLPPGTGTPPPLPGGTNVFDDPATKRFEELLNQRIAELQGPAYTNAQMDLMQTQALDPLERQRQQAHEQIIQRLAAHGIPPSSGLVERALEDIDRQFEQQRTTTQSGFATKAIDQTTANRNQAVSLAEILPNMAWARVSGAQTNPLSSPALLELLGKFQQSGFNNSGAFLQSLIPILQGLWR